MTRTAWVSRANRPGAPLMGTPCPHSPPTRGTSRHRCLRQSLSEVRGTCAITWLESLSSQMVNEAQVPSACSAEGCRPVGRQTPPPKATLSFLSHPVRGLDVTGRGSSQASRDFQVTAELWKFSLTTKSAPCSLSRFTSFSPKAFGGESLPNLQDNFSTA